MADLIITAASVVAGADAKIKTGTAGEAITAGQVVYLAAATKLLMKAINSDVAALAAVVGVALNSAAINQPVTYAYAGNVTMGATVAIGTSYLLSDTAGGIGPVADLLTSQFVTHIGVGKTAAIMTLGVRATGIESV